MVLRQDTTETTRRHAAEELVRAQTAFEDLKAGKGIPAVLEATIRVGLQYAGKDASALYTSGKKSADEVEAEIKMCLIQRVRGFVSMLERGQGSPDALVSSILGDLKHIGVDASALDPEGKKSADEMNAYIAELAKANKISKQVVDEMNTSVAGLAAEVNSDVRHIVDLVTETVVADIAAIGSAKKRAGELEKLAENLQISVDNLELSIPEARKKYDAAAANGKCVEEWSPLKTELAKLSQKYPGNTKSGLSEEVAAMVHKEVRNEVFAGRIDAEKWHQLTPEQKGRYAEKGLDVMITQPYRAKSWSDSVDKGSAALSR